MYDPDFSPIADLRPSFDHPWTPSKNSPAKLLDRRFFKPTMAGNGISRESPRATIARKSKSHNDGFVFLLQCPVDENRTGCDNKIQGGCARGVSLRRSLIFKHRRAVRRRRSTFGMYRFEQCSAISSVSLFRRQQMPPMMSHDRRAYFDSRSGLLVAAGSTGHPIGSEISHLQVALAMGRGRAKALLSLSSCTIISLLHHGNCWYRFKHW